MRSWPLTAPLAVSLCAGLGIFWPGQPWRATADYWAGSVALRVGAYPAAIRSFGNAIRRSPRLYEAYLGRAKAYYRLGDYIAAIPDLAVALPHLPAPREWSPNSAHTVLSFGHPPRTPALDAYAGGLESNILYRDPDSDARGGRLFARAAALDPALPGPYYFLGRRLQSQGKLRQAVADYVRAVRLDPRFALDWYALGDVNRSVAQDGAAIRYYSLAIGVDATLATAWASRAASYGNLGDVTRAYDDSSRAVALDPDYAMAVPLRAQYAAHLPRRA